MKTFATYEFNPDLAPSPEERAEAILKLEADLTSGYWMKIDDGLALKDLHSEKERLFKEIKLIVGKHEEYHPETYDYNNGVIAVITRNDELFVTPFTDERMRLVQNAYEKGSVPVPFSGGEIPADEDMEKRWEELRTIAQAEENKEKIRIEQQR